MKKIIALVLALVLVFSFAACGNTKQAETAAPELEKITVAASPTPHAEILAVAASVIEGYELEVIEYDDYVQPNMVVDSGEVYANYFQHTPYLDDFNAQNGTDVVAVAGIHVEPMGIYPGKSNDLANIADGAVIAVPNDTTNEARALLLLEENGVIKLDPNAGITATKNDIIENPHNVEIEEVEAAQVPNVLQDVDFGVINANYALNANLNPVNDAVAIEGSSSAYVNVLCVKAGNEDDPRTLALVKALQSDEVKKFIEENYNGNVVCVF